MKYRLLWAAAAAGVALHLAGLGWDAYMHAKDSTLASREGVFTLSNPSHALIIAGLALTTASLLGVAFTWAHERSLGGDGLVGRGLRLAALPCVGLAAAGAIWLASLAEDSSSHAHDDAAVTADEGHGHEDEVVNAANPGDPAAPPADESADHSHDEGEALGEGNAHTHGVEVPVTPEQLQAASEFYARVKEESARFEDIRDALGGGYVQITQDLPGIAAHFVNLTYNRDGVLMDPAKPEILLYTKRLDGTWRLVGFMFTSEVTTDEPPSFFGPLDVWHRHENLCFTPPTVRVTPNAASCPGLFSAVGPWNLHVWTAPGGSGVFAHDFAPIDPGPFPGATRGAAQDLVSRP